MKAVKSSMPATHAELWASKETIESLRVGLNSILNLQGKSPAYIADKVWLPWCDENNLGKGTHWATSKTLTRFCRGHTNIKSDITRTSLLIAVSNWVEGSIEPWEASNKNDTRRGMIQNVKELISLATTAHAAGLNDSNRRSTHAPQQNRLHLIVELFSKLMGINYDEIDQPKTQFFSTDQQNSNVPRSSFISYRYGVANGKITKSFFTIAAPDSVSAICRFGHFYINEEGRKRHARGIIVPFEKVVAFIGSVDNGEGVEILVFRRQKTPQHHYNGLMITLCDDAEPISSRITIVRSDCKNDLDADCGIKDLSDLSEAELKYVDLIRNKVSFSLESPIFYDGRNISQTQVVSVIGELLHLDGKDLLKFEDGSVFNPADGIHYTFNSALGLSKKT